MPASYWQFWQAVLLIELNKNKRDFKCRIASYEVGHMKKLVVRQNRMDRVIKPAEQQYIMLEEEEMQKSEN